MTNKEDFVTPTVDKRESKPSVQLRSPFFNTFESSSKDADKPQRKIMKTIIFSYPFRIDLSADPKVEDQKMFDDFIYEGLKHRNK